MSPKKIFLLGATGGSGLCTISAALSAGHTVTAYVRTPSKIPAALTSHPRLRVITGTLGEVDKLQAALAGQDVVISLLGPPMSEMGAWLLSWSQSGTMFADTYRDVVAGMKIHGVKRILAMGTVSITEARDRGSWARAAMVWVVWALAHRAWENVVNVGKYFDGLSKEDGVEWTVYRLGGVLDGDKGDVVAGWVGDGETTLSVRRQELGEWLVEEAGRDEARWVREKPMVSSARMTKGA
ncbi:hypothetical protein EDC01DRAFT_651427 [Geopyxis carbonaria]|nr:hypothetical protein EDC01DRAFT_651427 [Geopyxis carbonaria]